MLVPPSLSRRFSITVTPVVRPAQVPAWPSSAFCCRVGAGPRSGSREPMAPMLLAKSVGSIGMALPAFLGCQGLANRSAGQGIGRLGCRAGLQAIATRTDKGRSGQSPPSRWRLDEQGITTITVRRPAASSNQPNHQRPQIDRWAGRLSGAGSLGLATAGGGRAITGQAGPDPACLHRQPEAAPHQSASHGYSNWTASRCGTSS